MRELENFVERAVILATGDVLDADPAAGGATARRAQTEPVAASAEPAAMSGAPADERLEHVEREHILGALERARWVIEGPAGAAQALDLHPNTLRSRMKKLGIVRAGKGAG